MNHAQPHRVRMAALKLSAGRLDRLRQEIAAARIDHRDVLAAAAYPGYRQRVPGPGALPQAEVQRIVDADRQQHQDWLNR